MSKRQEVFMADIVNLGDNLKAQQQEIALMVATVSKFTAMGASPEHIARFLQATIDEINGGRMG